MATITIEGFIQVQASPDGSPRFDFITVEDMARYGWTCIAPHTITAEVPDDADYLPKHIANLGRKRAAALDEAARVEREIAQLRAIGKTD
jgi:hypothetical protein